MPVDGETDLLRGGARSASQACFELHLHPSAACTTFTAIREYPLRNGLVRQWVSFSLLPQTRTPPGSSRMRGAAGLWLLRLRCRE